MLAHIDKVTGSTAWTADFLPELDALERWEALVLERSLNG